MKEEELLDFLKKAYPKENEKCEWKQFSNLKHAVGSHSGDDIISYVSAIANMNGGHLVIGIEDKMASITGIQELHDYTPENLPFRVLSKCTNLSSEGLLVEEYVTTDTQKKVWVLHIPKHAPRRPVLTHGQGWQRIGDSLTELRKEREDAILEEPISNTEDWSAGVLDECTLDDLHAGAIQLARNNYKNKYPEQNIEVDEWNDITFLNKAKITIKGKITRTAIILLGKEESEHFISPSVAKLRWILKDQYNNDKDYEIFTCPLLVSAERVFNKIRNLKYRYMMEGSLFPEETDQYEPYTIREALNNCIAHQDYTRCGTINVVEREDGFLIFSNLGKFIPGSIDKVISDNSPEEFYRNRFLVNAMFNLKMVDTIGSGIRKMFAYQAKKFFPLPDYDLSDNKVKATITGKILDVEFAKALAQNSGLPLSDIILLDKVQKKQKLTKEQVAYLRHKDLIEGKMPNIYISATVAQVTGKKATYTLVKAFDKKYYFDLIEQALKQHHSLSKKEIQELLQDKLSSSYTAKQKGDKVNNLIQEMRRSNRIKNIGTDRTPKWVLVE